ncbi:phosphate ABC transporter permease PstA [Sandaracinobacter sp. RS1-74]|uniref:phosphate ABC transporter permease PstA n=1 Tax=Sandaracinobacteroides sayramensis TaxID=2913411 RepID=UPI001EDAEFF6|nr:phosphate ABC transporter permease PstA [Sandaracinobacteroides sayramensis]MCG2841026.1 phosphate ABC transporter permease PstA [Sandaracinobacteroides sayramensis]
MTEAVQTAAPTLWSSPAMQARIRRRYRSERLFKGLGLASLALACGFLLFLLASVILSGWPSFRQTQILVPVSIDAGRLGVTAAEAKADPERLRRANFQGVVQDAVDKSVGDAVPLVSEGAWLALREAVEADPALIGTHKDMWLIASSNLDQLAKGRIDLAAPEGDRPVNDQEIAAWKQLEADGKLRTAFNRTFLTAADSVDPELAGVWGALKGSFLTLVVTLLISFPVGVLAAIYLEEFAPKTRWTDVIEVSINNLAAVPSIIFGLLGLAVFLNTMNMPRSAPVVGGLTLALMTLPVIVIASRAALKAVPPSIRDAALGIGASPVQVVFHHVLPLALPGMLTGTILGMARALGETAPLLMIGMRAFLTSVPQGLAQPATVLPVQIFIWSDNVSRGFVEKTSGAILVLMAFLLAINSLAIYLRNRFEVRW